MRVVSKTAMVLAWAHVVWMTAGFAAPATGYAQAVTPPPPLPADAMVTVHLAGSERAELQRDTGDHKHFETVCSAPCDEQVFLKGSYRIGGDGVRSSKPFSLAETGPQGRTLYVRERSKGGFVLGIVGASVGFPVLGAGILIAVPSALDEGPGDDNHLGWLAATLFFTGLAMAVGGLVLMASNRHSGVSETPPEGAEGARLHAHAPPTIAVGGPGFTNLLQDTPAVKLGPDATGAPVEPVLNVTF
jgi:hypothetical protein